jgi:nicotinate-nucleotide pyrophosphorylase (carboxylating)
MSIYKLALLEDLEPNGDLSTKFFAEKSLKAQIIAKEAGVFACSELIKEIILAYQEISEKEFDFEINLKKQDGDNFKTGDSLVEIKAPSACLLICERIILNFLQRCCAIATKARLLSDLIKDTNCKVLDTRKTSPGMRYLEKLAFKQGGGFNHRFNLSDMAMLKENHLELLDEDLIAAIKKLKEQNCKIEVEINKDNLYKLETVCKEAIDQIMLDNFSFEELPEIISQIKDLNPEVKIEASGGINEKNILDYAKTGLDYVSTAEASRARNIDLSMIMISL